MNSFSQFTKMNMNIRTLVLSSFLVFFIFCNFLWLTFDPINGAFQHVLTFRCFDLYVHTGLDGISFFFVYLTAFLIPLCLLFTIHSRFSIQEKNNNIILTASVGVLLIIVFSVLDIFLFYISFEAVLVPFFVYIGISGYRIRRIHAAYLFFFYTLVGSFFMLISIFFFYLQAGSTDVEILWNTEILSDRSYLLWFALFLTFAIKVPMFPFHIWLPEAHVEAPTEGSVLLAGLLLKLGTYGFLRFLFPILPDLCYYFAPAVMMVASIGIIYTSLSTLRQVDIKRVVAYSSIAHMNMCMVGLFAYNDVAFIGSIFLMIAHGIVSGGLFFVIGILYSRFQTKIIQYYSGIIHFMPVCSFFFFMLVLGNIGMPGTSNFVGELLILCGITQGGNYLPMLAAAVGIFFCTVYSMWMYNKVIFLMPKFSYLVITDLFLFEIIILLPIVLLMLLLGIYPNSVLHLVDYAVHYHFFELFN